MSSLARYGFVAAVALSCAAAISCAAVPDDSSVAKLGVGDLDFSSYSAFVHPVIELRCGSLDCHGQAPRGLRVYGANSLRLPNERGDIPGLGLTTPDEARATYASILGLQPEKTNALVMTRPRTASDAYALLVLTKGTALERHRGGESMRKGDPAEQCLLTWLIGAANQARCAEAVRPR